MKACEFLGWNGEPAFPRPAGLIYRLVEFENPRLYGEISLVGMQVANRKNQVFPGRGCISDESDQFQSHLSANDSGRSAEGGERDAVVIGIKQPVELYPAGLHPSRRG